MKNIRTVLCCCLFLPFFIACSKEMQPSQRQAKQEATPAGTNAVTISSQKIVAGSGVYTGVAIWTVEHNITLLNNFEAMVGKKHDLVMWFHHWADNYDKNFNFTACNDISARGSIPYLSWCPSSDNNNLNQPAYKLTNITAGNFDTYITQFANDCKTYNKPLFLRFGLEMNAVNFLPWCGNTNGNNNGSDFVGAWRHVYGIFKNLGVGNVTWVWCPYVESLDSSWPPLENYYPGDAYVDWVGMDGYGYSSASWAYSTSNTFDKTFSSTYDKLKLYNKPLMIAEIGCGEDGSNADYKYNWIIDAYKKIQLYYPLVKAATWFQYDKEQNWLVNSSVTSKNAYVTSIAGSYFSSPNNTTTPINLLINPGFEDNGNTTQTPSGWSEYNATGASYTEGNPRSGSYNLAHYQSSAYEVSTYQSVKGLAAGKYRLTGWVKSSGGQSSAYLSVKNYGGSEVKVNIPTSGSWVQLTLSDINVTSNQAEVHIYSNAPAGKWINVDDLILVKQ